MYDLDLCIVYLDILTRGVFVVILCILLWVSSWTCVTVATWFHSHHVHATTCTRCLVVRFQSDIMRIVAWSLRSARCQFWGVIGGHPRTSLPRCPPFPSCCHFLKRWLNGVEVWDMMHSLYPLRILVLWYMLCPGVHDLTNRMKNKRRENEWMRRKNEEVTNGN
jgi:hypothetical protein